MTSESLTLAAAHHQAGRLDQAETLYRKAISEKPNDPQALHLLGTLLFQTARAREALPPLERAASIDPRRADFQLNLAVVLLALSRPLRRQRHAAAPLPFGPIGPRPGLTSAAPWAR